MCVQLSVEVNGTLVGDSPYLVMFEIDDDAELTTENADGTMPVARKVCYRFPMIRAGLNEPSHDEKMHLTFAC